MSSKPDQKRPTDRVLLVDVDKIESAVLRRIVREVRNDGPRGAPRCFDRIHNRHNRS